MVHKNICFRDHDSPDYYVSAGLDKPRGRTLKYDSRDISRKEKRFEAAKLRVAEQAVCVYKCIHVVRNYTVTENLKFSPMVSIGEIGKISSWRKLTGYMLVLITIKHQIDQCLHVILDSANVLTLARKE